jgi:hypothetical protein
MGCAAVLFNGLPQAARVRRLRDGTTRVYTARVSIGVERGLKGDQAFIRPYLENCYAMSLTTGFKTFLYCFESDNVRIVCPISEREYDGYIDIVKPFGFSGFVGNGDCSEFRYYWKEFARQRGYVCGYLGLNPIFDYSSHFDPDEVHQYDTVHVLDLTLSLDELWVNLNKNRKKQLKDWDAIRHDLSHEKPVLTDFFLAHYEDFFRRKGAEQFYFFSRETISFLLSLDNVMIAGAPNTENVAAVTVFAYTADVADDLFHVYLPTGKGHSAALIWQGVNHFKSLQIPLLNLGGGGGGMREYKRYFGGRELDLKCIKQSYDPDIYEKLCRRANADPNDRTGYFPPYRKGV